MTKNDFREERDGGSKRVAAVVREFNDAGFVVDFLAIRPMVSQTAELPRSARPAAILPVIRVLAACLMSRSFSSLKWFDPRVAVMISRLVRSEAYCGYIVENSHLFMYQSILPNPVAIDLHNVESELLSNYARNASSLPRRLAATHEARRTRAIERRLLGTFDLVAVVSDHDRSTMLRLRSAGSLTARLVVAPNGVSDECFQFVGERENRVVFVAHLGWRPNIDAAVWLVEEVWPHVRRLNPDLRLNLIGRTPSHEVLALNSDDVEVIPDVPSTVPYVGSAAVATAPLLAAGGTRLKILESLATGTPLVATSLGALGLEHLAGHHLAIVDDPKEFATAIVTSAKTAPERGPARQLVEPYRWRTALEPLVKQFDIMTSVSRP